MLPYSYKPVCGYLCDVTSVKNHTYKAAGFHTNPAVCSLY